MTTPPVAEVRATLLGGPCDQAAREVDATPPDVLLCTDQDDATLEHLYRLRGLEGAGDQELAVYEYAPAAPPVSP